jgi:hypothetical protein
MWSLEWMLMMMFDLLPGTLLGLVCFQMLAETCWFMDGRWCLLPSLYLPCVDVMSLFACVQDEVLFVMAGGDVKSVMACCTQGFVCFKC